MIFVTVGTHEQPFNRLIGCMDELKGRNVIQEEVIMQTGYSTYVPQYCQWKKMLSYDEMSENVRNARIVITHGGPASFFMPLQLGKTPIVVPRQKRYGEHVNDHQLLFTRTVVERQQNIVLIENITDLEECILHYDALVEQMPRKIQSNNENFNVAFEMLVEDLFRQEH